MHLVPIIPQPKTGVEERFEVKGVAAPGAVKPVAGRTSSPPPLVYAHVQQGASEIPQPHLQTHKRRAGDRPETVDQGERRLACRRFSTCQFWKNCDPWWTGGGTNAEKPIPNRISMWKPDIFRMWFPGFAIMKFLNIVSL